MSQFKYPQIIFIRIGMEILKNKISYKVTTPKTYPVTSSNATKSGSQSSSVYSSIICELFSELPLPELLAVSTSVELGAAAGAADVATTAAGGSARSYAGSEPPDAVARLSSSGASAGFEMGRSSRERRLAPSILSADASSRHASSVECNDLGSILEWSSAETGERSK